MRLEPYLDALGIPPPSETSLEVFSNLIIDTIDQVNKRLKVSHHRVPDEPLNIIHLSFLLSPVDEWKSKFTYFRRVAFRYFITSDIFWATIATGPYTPTIGEAYKKFDSTFDPRKYLKNTSTTPSPQRISPELTTKPKRKHFPQKGQLWKLDRRWDHLWPSSHKVFEELLRRTQYPKRPENFPWCQAGIKSLAKFTGYSPRQIQDALIQLQRFKLIKRIVKGNNFQGASKYLVFITPSMSGAFSRKSLRAKKHPPYKNRISRIA